MSQIRKIKCLQSFSIDNKQCLENHEYYALPVIPNDYALLVENKKTILLDKLLFNRTIYALLEDGVIMEMEASESVNG